MCVRASVFMCMFVRGTNTGGKKEERINEKERGKREADTERDDEKLVPHDARR